MTYPELGENESFARHPDAEGDLAICRYSTPDADNGNECSPPTVTGLSTTENFEEAIRARKAGRKPEFKD